MKGLEKRLSTYRCISPEETHTPTHTETIEQGHHYVLSVMLRGKLQIYKCLSILYELKKYTY